MITVKQEQGNPCYYYCTYIVNIIYCKMYDHNFITYIIDILEKNLHSHHCEEHIN